MMQNPIFRAHTRRNFLGMATAALASTRIPSLRAAPRERLESTGIQLAWLTPDLETNFDGTLGALAAMGYTQVELLGGFGRSPRQLLASLKSAGLRCESALFWLQPEPKLAADITKQIEFAHALGLKYLVCLSPLPPGVAVEDSSAPALTAALDKLTLDDFKREAELFNRIGEQTKKAGIQFAYHNFNVEFRSFNGVLGYDELLRSTDPALVKMEMDIGWLTASGEDPARYLREHPGRFPLVHIKDVANHDPNHLLRLKPIEVGKGIVDWPKVMAAARAAGARIGYVEYEPEPPPFERSLLASARLCLDYLQAQSER
jgi:sugar phosphate isomerase/epimerase